MILKEEDFVNLNLSTLLKSKADNSEANQSELKLDLENEKLFLERRVLQRQASWQGWAMDWLKAITVPAAILGIIMTYDIGVGQFRASEEARVADRFDKALTRLGSTEEGERTTALTTLRLFLSSGNQEREPIILLEIVNALAREQKELVRRSILELLEGNEVGNAQQQSKDEALRKAVTRNRDLARSIMQSSARTINEMQLAAVKKFNSDDRDLNPSNISEYSEKSHDAHVALASVSNWPFDHADEISKSKLGGLSRGIEILVKHGASVKDFEEIVCDNCDFTNLRHIDSTSFDRAILRGADFSHTKLVGYHFTNADIRGVKFFNANLFGALLNRNDKAVALDIDAKFSLPILDCADLRHANLSNAILMSVNSSQNSAEQIRILLLLPNVTGAIMDSTTQISGIYIVNTREYNNAYIENLPRARTTELQQELRGVLQLANSNGANTRYSVESIMFESRVSAKKHYRIGSFFPTFSTPGAEPMDRSTGYVFFEDRDFKYERNGATSRPSGPNVRESIKKAMSQATSRAGWNSKHLLSYVSQLAGEDLAKNLPVGQAATGKPRYCDEKEAPEPIISVPISVAVPLNR